MNSLTTRRLSRGIATAFAVAGVAAAIGTPLNGLAATSNQLGTPDDGVMCRSGYTPTFTGTRLTCSKAGSFDVVLRCKNPTFPVYVVRVGGPAPKGDDDICIRNNGTTINISQSLEGLNESTNGVSGVYEYAKFDPAEVANRTVTQDALESRVLGLQPNEVDTRAGAPVLRPNARAGGAGEARVPVTSFTFAVPGPGLITPGPVTPTTSFIPRPLP